MLKHSNVGAHQLLQQAGRDSQFLRPLSKRGVFETQAQERIRSDTPQTEFLRKVKDSQLYLVALHHWHLMSASIILTVEASCVSVQGCWLAQDVLPNYLQTSGWTGCVVRIRVEKCSPMSDNLSHGIWTVATKISKQPRLATVIPILFHPPPSLNTLPVSRGSDKDGEL